MGEIGEKELEFQAGLYVIELLRAVLEERKPQEKPEILSMKRIYGMAKKHSVECMAYEGAVQIAGPEDEAVMEKWKERSRLCGIQGMVQMAEAEKLFKELPAHGIRILPLKGCIMKKMYPKEAYRQMADLDILIDEKNAGKAREVMESLGYEEKPEGGGVDSYVKKPWMSVELHSLMLPTQYKNWKKYLDIWERADGENGIYRMNWDDYYVYMIEHFAKHFYLSGSGIRSILDIHVFLGRMQDQLNPDYLRGQFRERNLEKFYKEMEELAANWFSKGVTGEKRNVEELIIFSGVYGTENGRLQNVKGKIAEKHRAPWIVKAMYILKRVFPSYRVMYDCYPAVKKCPLMLPVMWIYRAVAAVFKRPEKIKRELAFIRKKEKE